MRFLFILISLAFLAGPAFTRAQDCGALTAAAIAGATVQSAAAVAAGPFTLPATGRLPAKALMLPAFCRVKGTAVPRIHFELWLPEGHWNGRLLSLGSGGFGGQIDLRPLATYVRQGYAVTANDTGHSGEGTEWMRDPKALLAWGHDATHRVTGPTKDILRRYYGKSPADSYFQGCSTGGAQAMEEAEYFPSDFNGIVAESPGMDYSDLMLSFIWGLQSAQEHATLTDEKLQLLHSAVVARCDRLDGLQDGLIGRPLACHVPPETLACQPGQQSGCLTAQEIKTAELLYQGPRNSQSGAEIYPGFVRGSEAESAFHGPRGGLYGWSLIQGPLARQYAVPLLKNMVFGPDWDWKSFDWNHDVARVNDALRSKIDSMNPDLRPFWHAGGKLVMIQGWGDPLNAQTLPIEYRRSVIATFADSMPHTQAERTVADFYRLFMAPGMGHCLGGPGPSSVDALAPLRTWVERGKAPTRLVATKVSGPQGEPTKPLMRRPLCPYPSYARYVGGDANQPDSFRCVVPTGTKAAN